MSPLVQSLDSIVLTEWLDYAVHEDRDVLIPVLLQFGASVDDVLHKRV